MFGVCRPTVEVDTDLGSSTLGMPRSRRHQCFLLAGLPVRGEQSEESPIEHGSRRAARRPTDDRPFLIDSSDAADVSYQGAMSPRPAQRKIAPPAPAIGPAPRTF